MKVTKIKDLEFLFAKEHLYCNRVLALDIETSNNHADKPEDLITWISSIQVLFNDHYYLFRYPEEFINFLKILIRQYGLYQRDKWERKIICIIHNASYDLSYLIPYLEELPHWGNYQGIIEGPNKILTYVRGCFEFRCTYRQSGMSLYKWSNELNVKHKKQLGLYDYDAIIYPDDELDEKSLKYDKYDVLALEECFVKFLKVHNDTIASTVLTSTGLVRRELRRSCKNDKHYYTKYFQGSRLDAELYDVVNKSFSGGFTHNNRFWRDQLLEVGKTYPYLPFNEDPDNMIKFDRIAHRDFRSHYPSQLLCRPMPFGKPAKVYDVTSMPFPITINEILSWFPEFSSMTVIRLYKASLRDPLISMPFMQASKCYESNFDIKKLDNGRILYASGEWIMYLDNLTLQILNEQYKMQYEILAVWKMKNCPMPDCITKVIDKYFKGKSDKKIIHKALEKEFGKLDPRTLEADFELSTMKKFLNGQYGVFATNPLRPSYQIGNEMEFSIKKMYNTQAEITSGLDGDPMTGEKGFYCTRNNFLPYQIGVFCTAYARFELYEYIKTVGYQNCLYCDTDSIYYRSTPEIEERIEALNAEKRKTAHYVVLDNGERMYYDVFEGEADCLAFKGLHSKCYGIISDKGELQLTIAGVPARTLTGMKDGEPQYYTREQEMKDIAKTEDNFKALDALDDQFEFTVNAGVSALYVGATGYQTPRVPTILNINGHEIHTAGGCVIRPLKVKKVKGLGLKLPESVYQEMIDISGFN